MPDKLILDFPILQQDGDNFVDEVSYEVEAYQYKIDRKLKIIHTLKGRSFINKLVKSGDAKFSVLSFYRDSSERQNNLCNAGDIFIQGNTIVATQTIPIKFSYAPKIMSSIVLVEEKKIVVDSSSGLTDFWEHGDYFDIPQYSRIALGQTLNFTSGAILNLIEIKPDENLSDGQMKVTVNEYSREGETPVFLLCGRGVYDELHRVTPVPLSDETESMRSAIVTQALCAVYAYMHEVSKNDEFVAGGVLSEHLKMLENETGENWRNKDNFNPSLAATKMQPYVTKFDTDTPQ